METSARSQGRGRRWLLVAVSIAVLVMIGPWRDRVIGPLNPWRPPVNDCQQDNMVVHLAHGDSIIGANLPLIARIADLPEYHDCQRFVVGRGGGAVKVAAERKFGPLIAIWAADSLGSRFRHVDSAGHDTTTGPSRATPVAVIHNFDRRATYTPLGINPGFNCLYLWHDAEVPRHWSAAIVAFDPKSGSCEATLAPEALASGPLTVQSVDLHGRLGTEAIPPVARWDWDAKNGQQYIDIRCGEEWCQVGPGGFVSAPSAFEGSMTLERMRGLPDITYGSPSDDDIMKVVAVKGWYDEQELDAPSWFGKSHLAKVQGTVIPHPALERADFTTRGAWIPVAYISVTAEYEGKMHLSGGMNTEYLCTDDPAAAGSPRCDGVEGLATCDTESAESPYKWYTKLVPESGPALYYCVKRRDHNGKAIPAAAARWNWFEKVDATTWVKCSGGCCTVN